MGISTEAPAGQGVLSQVYQVEQQGERNIQVGGQQSSVSPLGPAQE